MNQLCDFLSQFFFRYVFFMDRCTVCLCIQKHIIDEFWIFTKIMNFFLGGHKTALMFCWWEKLIFRIPACQFCCVLNSHCILFSTCDAAITICKRKALTVMIYDENFFFIMNWCLWEKWFVNLWYDGFWSVIWCLYIV